MRHRLITVYSCNKLKLMIHIFFLSLTIKKALANPLPKYGKKLARAFRAVPPCFVTLQKIPPSGTSIEGNLIHDELR